MLFSVTIFFTKLPSLTASHNGSTLLIYFTSLRTWQIFNTKYIVNIDNADPLILNYLEAASLT